MNESSTSSSISSANFDDFNAKLQAAALKATRHALSIPSDVAFRRSVDPQFAQNLEALSSRVLTLTNRILAFISTADNSNLLQNKGKSRLNDLSDVVDNFSSIVVDPVDLLFEGVVSLIGTVPEIQTSKGSFVLQDNCLDEYLGRKKPPAIAININPPEVISNTKVLSISIAKQMIL
jgi:exosome complex exonuclease RRP6